MKPAWSKDEEKAFRVAAKKATSWDDLVARMRKVAPQREHSRSTLEAKARRLDIDVLGIIAANRPPIVTPEKAISAAKEKTAADRLKELNKQLVAELTDAKGQLEMMKALSAAKPAKAIVAPKKVGGKQRTATPVMLCSDWHVEEIVDPATVNGLNEYNPQIAERCIDILGDAYAWMMKDARFDIRQGVLWLGGDLYSGYIHEELAEGNAMSPMEVSLWLQVRLERFIRRILAETELERLIVVCNDGNHGRATHKIRVATRTANSIEWLMYQTLARAFANEPRVEFQIAEGEWNYLPVYRQTFGFTHGDSFKYGGGVGGLLIPVRRGLNEMRKYIKVDHVSMGHFHQRMDDGEVSVNGSMIGITPYSMRIHAKPEPRQQSWFLVDSERGKCISAPVWLPNTAKR